MIPTPAMTQQEVAEDQMLAGIRAYKAESRAERIAPAQARRDAAFARMKKAESEMEDIIQELNRETERFTRRTVSLRDAHAKQQMIKKVISVVCREYKVSYADLRSGIREKTLASARGVIAYFLRSLTQMSYEAIGTMLSKHHTTVQSAIHSAEKRLKESLYASKIERLRTEITSAA